MSERQLQEAERRYQAALKRASDALATRDEVIRRALASGWTQRQIARTIGVSPGRIGQIATERKP